MPARQGGLIKKDIAIVKKYDKHDRIKPARDVLAANFRALIKY